MNFNDSNIIPYAFYDKDFDGLDMSRTQPQTPPSH